MRPVCTSGILSVPKDPAAVNQFKLYLFIFARRSESRWKQRRGKKKRGEEEVRGEEEERKRGEFLTVSAC